MDNLFNFLVYESGLLKYSKYNFKFDDYAIDFGLVGKSNIEIFSDFFDRNETDYYYAITVKYELKKYFSTITTDIKNYVSKYGVLHSVWLNYLHISKPLSYFEEHQFELIEYDDISLIQDFIYNKSITALFTKYKFDFNLYKSDFNITDNNLVVFTDCIFRNYKLSYNSTYANTRYYKITDGYVVLPEFELYFDHSGSDIIDYMTTKAIMSNNILPYKNFENVNWSIYYQTNHLSYMTVDEAKYHYIHTGQFSSEIIVDFYDPVQIKINNAKKNVATIYLDNVLNTPIATGFLYKDNQENIYIITVYHIISNYRDQKYVYGVFENGIETNFTAQFKIIGYDSITDLLIAYYDSSTNYNTIHNPDFTKQEFINLSYSFKPENGNEIYMISNINLNTNLSIIKGTIMDTSYSGGFSIDNSIEIIPSSLLIECSAGNVGSSGSPILIYDNNELINIGMVIGSLKNVNGDIIGLNNYVLMSIIKTSISRYNMLNTFEITNNDIIESYINNGYPKTWLGICSQYYHPILGSIYKELMNFRYVGGLVITNFILGFNYKNNEFVFNSRDLVDRNVVKLFGPLLNSNLYNNFINGGNVPIVIKSITFHDGIYNEETKLRIGKFGTQETYSRYIYGNNYTSLNYNDNTTYNNKFIMSFTPIIIDYYYYDGSTWIETTETIGNTNTDINDWYVDYTDNSGKIYHQHKFEYPNILLPYAGLYTISKYSYNIENEE